MQKDLSTEFNESEKSSPPAAQLLNDPWDILMPYKPPFFQVLGIVSLGSFLIFFSLMLFLILLRFHPVQKRIKTENTISD